MPLAQCNGSASGDTVRSISPASSLGRALPSHGRGRRFDPVAGYGSVVERIIALASKARDWRKLVRRFESGRFLGALAESG